MELAAHWHRCQNLPKKRVNTSLVYRERDDPVKDGLANWQGFLVYPNYRKSLPHSNCKASTGCAQKWRICEATLGTWSQSIKARTPPLSAAKASGAPVIRTWQASSPKVTSRRKWRRFSIRQWACCKA